MVGVVGFFGGSIDRADSSPVGLVLTGGVGGVVFGVVFGVGVSTRMEWALYTAGCRSRCRQAGRRRRTDPGSPFRRADYP